MYTNCVYPLKLKLILITLFASCLIIGLGGLAISGSVLIDDGSSFAILPIALVASLALCGNYIIFKIISNVVLMRYVITPSNVVIQSFRKSLEIKCGDIEFLHRPKKHIVEIVLRNKRSYRVYSDISNFELLAKKLNFLFGENQ